MLFKISLTSPSTIHMKISDTKVRILRENAILDRRKT